jgi:hypothetical protein
METAPVLSQQALFLLFLVLYMNQSILYYLKNMFIV